MKNVISSILVLFFTALSVNCFAQLHNDPISNVTVRVSEERDKVTITYDLDRNSGIQYYEIKLTAKLDGETIPVSLNALKGDIGPQIIPGLGKTIVWDVLQDVLILDGKLTVEVYTITKSIPCIPIKTVPVYAGIAGTSAVGLTLIIAGLNLESESKELYDVYKMNLNPMDGVYDEISREDYFNEANKKHKQGQWYVIGGSAVIVAGGVILINRLIKIKKYNKACLKSLGNSKLKLEPFYVLENSNNTTGLSLTYKF